LVFYGASTGAAAALDAAAQLEFQTLAVISRGGRPDLADSKSLKEGRTPVILLVGSLDRVVLALNREAMDRMGASRYCELRAIEGATHLFEEPGALDQVAEQSVRFLREALERRSKAAA
jgi:alpha-beta hydrolase superfamily lysophospholipase